MNCTILHESRGRLRLHLKLRRMTAAQADALADRLEKNPAVRRCTVYERTCDLVVCYTGSRQDALAAVRELRLDAVPDAPANSARCLNREYQEKLVGLVARRALRWLFLPAPARAAVTVCRVLRFVRQGWDCLRRGRLEVEVLDALSIGVSVLRGDISTAGSVMFLLDLGSLLEEWTRKKSVADLARSMSLHVDQVWLRRGNTEVQLPIGQVRPGDEVVVHTGSVIPLDGIVAGGEAMVNQASMTGEPLAVRKGPGAMVYAGTVVEEGCCTLTVRQAPGANRYDKIVAMIESSEKLRSSTEDRALELADRLVPWCLGGTALTWLVTRNVTRAVSILMVDFSCALKLAMPLAVLSAMRECGAHRITVKGGRYLEVLAGADTIVFDKTGTLTRATPTVAEVVPFGGYTQREVLRIAACLEEHYPHSMANAVVRRAQQEGVRHDEMHSEVAYVVAHGIASRIDGQKAVIGSYHFVFEDEGCTVPDGEQARFDGLPPRYSQLYLAIGGQLAGVVCIADPLRPEARSVLTALKAAGLRTVMMTGDNEHTASAVAAEVGVDQYFAGVLPEDKARFVEAEKAAGRTVVMIGDGINDSPALSAADVGIAISDGAAIAREIADITVAADDLRALVTLKRIADALARRTASNYRFVLGFNSGLILLGALGILQPAASALLHNASTIGISLKSMTDLLGPQEARKELV